MNKNIYFSIIIVSLNTKEKLRNTLESVYKQKIYPKNYEIIVVDGMSIDGTQEEILNKKNKIDKLIIEKDAGIYDAMNKGIKYANGEWIIFLNSGDLFYKNNILKKIYSYKLSENDVIYGDTIVNNKEFKYKINGKLFNKNSINIPFCHQSSFVKTELIKKKFDTKYKVSSDFNFFLNCFKDQKKFCYIDKYLSRIKGGGLSDLSRQLVYNENIEILRKNNLNYQANFLYLYKIKDYFLSIIKKYIPQKMLTELIKIKNKKNLIKQ